MKLKDWDEDENQNMERVEAQPEDSIVDVDMEEMLSGMEDDWEEEIKPLKPWGKMLIFFGLAVPAAIICAVLWIVMHPDRPEEDSFLAEATQSPQPSETFPEEEEQPGEEAASGQETESEEGSEPVQDTVSVQIPEPTEQPATAQPSVSETSQPAAADAGEEEKEPVSGNTGMSFSEVQDSVTPKDVTNLRSAPTTQDADNIATQAKNGETLSRNGVNQDTGWSRIDYNGQTLYAVTQYLTTDLSYKPPLQPSDPNRVSTISGRIIIFTNCDDWITPKEYVNLRTEPSTSEGDATVSCQLNNGEKAHRTGYSTDSGWSRVEYNGQVLYVVTSLMNITAE